MLYKYEFLFVDPLGYKDFYSFFLTTPEVSCFGLPKGTRSEIKTTDG